MSKSKKHGPEYGHNTRLIKEGTTFQKVRLSALAWKRLQNYGQKDSPRYYNFLVGKLLRNLTKTSGTSKKISKLVTGTFFKSSPPDLVEIASYLEQHADQVHFLDLHSLSEEEIDLILGVLPKKVPLEAIDLENAHITREQFDQFSTYFSDLKILKMGRNQTLNEESLITIPNSCSALNSIDLSECKHLSNSVLMKFSEKIKLEELNLRLCSKVSSEGIDPLLQVSPKLTSFNAIACPIGDSTVYTLLEHCPHTTDLFLGVNDTLSSKAISAIVKKPKNLDFLHLTSIPAVSDAHLEQMDLPRLLHLNLYGCENISSQGVAQVLQKHPQIQDCIVSLSKEKLEGLGQQFPHVNFNFHNSLQSW